MDRDVLSVRQMMVLMAAALLAPATVLLPSLAVRMTGGGGWLAVLGALPLLLAALWAASVLCRQGGFCRAVGKVPGRALTIIYMVWTLLLLTLAVRLCAVRLAQISGDEASFINAALLLAVAVWMGRGKVSAFARAGEIFYLTLAVALVGVLLLAVGRVEWSNLRPSGDRPAALPIGSLAAAGILLNVYPAFVLGCRVASKPRNGRRAAGWVTAFCLACVLLTGAVIGNLGVGLTARLDAPFFLMAQGLGIEGAFQRTEALVTALWAMSDLTLMGLLLHAWRALAGELGPGKWGRQSLPGVAAVALAGSWLIFGGAEETRRFCEGILPILGLTFGLLFPLLICFFQMVFKRKAGG